MIAEVETRYADSGAWRPSFQGKGRVESWVRKKGQGDHGLLEIKGR